METPWNYYFTYSQRRTIRIRSRRGFMTFYRRKLPLVVPRMPQASLLGRSATVGHAPVGGNGDGERRFLERQHVAFQACFAFELAFPIIRGFFAAGGVNAHGVGLALAGDGHVILLGAVGFCDILMVDRGQAFLRVPVQHFRPLDSGAGVSVRARQAGAFRKAGGFVVPLLFVPFPLLLDHHDELPARSGSGIGVPGGAQFFFRLDKSRPLLPEFLVIRV